jgi:hypothetical protein
MLSKDMTSAGITETEAFHFISCQDHCDTIENIFSPMIFWPKLLMRPAERAKLLAF